MTMTDKWRLEEKQHKERQRSVYPMSSKRARRRSQSKLSNIPENPQWEKSPRRAFMTSQLMSTTFKYRNTTAATVLRFMLSHGERPISMSQILRFGLEGMENMILDSAPEFAVTSESEALQWLEKHGLSPGNDSRANLNRIANNLRLENSLGQSQSMNPSTSPGLDSDFILDPKEVALAQELLKKANRPQVYFNPTTVAKVNAESKSESEFESAPAPALTPAPEPPAPEPPAQIELKQTVLREDGITFEVKQDKAKARRVETMILCIECKKNPSHVLLDFEPIEGQPIIADCCPNCDGVTTHFIVTKQMALNGFTMQELDPCDPKELKRLTEEAMKKKMIEE